MYGRITSIHITYDEMYNMISNRRTWRQLLERITSCCSPSLPFGKHIMTQPWGYGFWFLFVTKSRFNNEKRMSWYVLINMMYCILLEASIYIIFLVLFLFWSFPPFCIWEGELGLLWHMPCCAIGMIMFKEYFTRSHSSMCDSFLFLFFFFFFFPSSCFLL